MQNTQISNQATPQTTSLIITTYNQKERLSLVLDSVRVLNPLPKEVLIADDGSTSDTRELIESYAQNFPCELHHIWQEDKGFRAGQIRNEAIKSARGEYIIIIDGDMILDSRFITEHLRFAQRGVVLQGSRVILGQDKTDEILKQKDFKLAFKAHSLNSLHCNILAKFIYKTSKITAVFFEKKDLIKGVRSCNMSFFKSDCEAINGFNEEFVGWGREDSEFVARFLFNGGEMRRVKFNAIAYHLYHPENSRAMLESNHNIYIYIYAKLKRLGQKWAYKSHKESKSSHTNYTNQIVITAKETTKQIGGKGARASITNTFDTHLDKVSANTRKISVCIIVKNAQKTLAECLESVKDFDEIILLDNGSTDKTLQIAQEFNATYKNLRVKQSAFIGFGALKNLCVSFAKNEWILSLDSDEVLESIALREINALDLEPNHIYALPRKNLYNGEWIKACGWYPDFVWRVFNKNFTRFNDNTVHESVMIPKDAQKIYLKGAIRHYAFANIDNIIAKMNRYTSQSAQEKLKNGRKTSFFAAFVRLHFVFFKDYFLRKGFLYGYKGFIVALLNALGAFFRYAKLYELDKDKKEPKVIAFDRRLGVGDIISSIPAFYLTKQLYPQATFILITNKIGASLCRNFNFIDKFIIEGVDFEIKDFAKVVDENAVEVLILGHRSSANIKLAKQSKCPKIITWRHLHSIFSQRFIHPKHIKRSQRLEILRCLDLVRMIDTLKYDKNIDKFELKSLRIQTDRKNKIFVDEFLGDTKKYEKIIAISPFGISSAKYNLAIDDWISLAKNLAKKFDKALFVFMNFRGSGYEFKPFIEENIKVFANNDDLLNLVELTSRVNLCISLSTGNIHIADNLGIDTLGFFAYTDEFLFSCGNYGGNFEVIYLPKDWKKDYEFYKNAFYQKAQKCVEKILLGYENYGKNRKEYKINREIPNILSAH